jgi:hypothetical protein
MQRKDLTPYERSKTVAQLGATARTVAVAEVCCPGIGVNRCVVLRPTWGPWQTPSSYRDAEQRVAAAKKYPELMAFDILQHGFPPRCRKKIR